MEFEEGLEVMEVLEVLEGNKKEEIMPNREELLSIYYITDAATGDYHIGEIDFGINRGLKNYLQVYGEKGKEDLLKTLSYLIYEVERKYRAINANRDFCGISGGLLQDKNRPY